MDSLKENLVRLIASTEYGRGSQIGDNFQKGFLERIAIHLIANGVTLNSRDCHWATEQAYKNGYNKGYEDGIRERKRKKETKCTDSGRSLRTVEALDRMGQKAHGGEDG